MGLHVDRVKDGGEYFRFEETDERRKPLGRVWYVRRDEAGRRLCDILPPLEKPQDQLKAVARLAALIATCLSALGGAFTWIATTLKRGAINYD